MQEWLILTKKHEGKSAGAFLDKVSSLLRKRQRKKWRWILSLDLSCYQLEIGTSSEDGHGQMERPVSQGYSWATKSITWVQHPHDLRLAVMRGNKFPDWQFEWSLLLSEAKSIPVKMWFYGWCCPDLEEAKGFMEALSPSRRWEKFQRVVCVCSVVSNSLQPYVL